MSLRLWIVDLFCFLHHVDGLFTCFHIFSDSVAVQTVTLALLTSIQTYVAYKKP